jgi:hypothetical protein
MKTKYLCLALALVLLTSPAFPQGSLAPPGPPAPTMKSLDQIEPRTPISSLPFTISSSGSYYLTANLNVTSGNAITVNASNVTLDLNGFAISSTAPSANGTAIMINDNLRNIAIGNGLIQSGVTVSGGVFSGSGFASGINYNSTAPVNARVTNISVVGVLSSGIYLVSAPGSVIESCSVNIAGNFGVGAVSVRDSIGLNCGGYGVGGTIVDHCYGTGTGGGVGLSANVATNCRGDSDSSDGLSASNAINCHGASSTSANGISGTNVAGSTGFSATGKGISAGEVSNSYGQSNGANDGIFADSALNCRGQSSTGRGLNVRNAENCRASTTSSNPAIDTYTAMGCSAENFGSGAGIFAQGPVTNCYAQTSGAGSGISAAMATNSYGRSTGSGFGLSATIAIGCSGSSNTGTGLSAFIGTSCTGSSTSGSALSITNRYNMP